MPQEGPPNHGSAMRHGKDIVIPGKETGLQSMFEGKPFTNWDRRIPKMTGPKRDTNARRVILDLAYPVGRSVNTTVRWR